MSYQGSSDLSKDAEFAGRLTACLNTEAQPKPPDDQLAAQILAGMASGASMFMPYVSTAPGFAEAYETGGQESITDGQVLSAVQANWDNVSRVRFGA